MFIKQYNLQNITKIEKCKPIVSSSIFSDKYIIKYVFNIIFNNGIIEEISEQDYFYKSHSSIRWIKTSRMIKENKTNAELFSKCTETENLYKSACCQLQELLNILHNNEISPKRFTDGQMYILKEDYPIFLNNIDNINCGLKWYLDIYDMVKNIEKLNEENRKVKIIADHIRESRGKLYVNWHIEDYSFGDCKEWCKYIVDKIEDYINKTSLVCEEKCSLCGASIANISNPPCICEVVKKYVY